MRADDIERAAEILASVRRDRRGLPDLPAELRPQTIAEAYAIQDAVVARQGGVGGWKIGPPTPGVEPKCAPVAAAYVFASPAASTSAAALIAPEIEVEIAVRFASDLPPRPAPYTAADVDNAIGSVHPALEILSSRFADRKAAWPLSVVADGQSNGAIVYGAGVREWRTLEFATVAMSLTFDGKAAGSASGGASTVQVLEALAWLANHIAARAGGLRAGQVVITGARIKPTPVPVGGAVVVAEVAGIGNVSASVR